MNTLLAGILEKHIERRILALVPDISLEFEFTPISCFELLGSSFLYEPSQLSPAHSSDNYFSIYSRLLDAL